MPSRVRYDSIKIAEAIRKAVRDARADLKDMSDGGTCCFDAAYIRVPWMRTSRADEISRLSGVPVHIRESRWHGRILMIEGCSGQAAKRTAGAEAVYRDLKADGFDAGVWYQMD